MEIEQSIPVQASTVLEVLDQFSTSAEGIAKFSHLVKQEVEEGRADALRVAIYMKTMEKIVKDVNEGLSRHYLDEASRQTSNDKPFEFRGATISFAEHGVKYDYSKCGHPGWNDLTKIIEHAIEQRKEIEALLKVIKGPTDLIIEGEPLTVTPPVKSGKAGINISIK